MGGVMMAVLANQDLVVLVVLVAVVVLVAWALLEMLHRVVLVDLVINYHQHIEIQYHQ